MECSLCLKQCQIPNKTNSQNIAIIKDGVIFCMECYEIHDWLEPSKPSKNQLEKIPEKLPEKTVMKKPATNLANIYCPKCKSYFTEAKCPKNCGFKNPLLR